MAGLELPASLSGQPRADLHLPLRSSNDVAAAGFPATGPVTCLESTSLLSVTSNGKEKLAKSISPASGVSAFWGQGETLRPEDAENSSSANQAA